MMTKKILDPLKENDFVVFEQMVEHLVICNIIFIKRSVGEE